MLKLKAMALRSLSSGSATRGSTFSKCLSVFTNFGKKKIGSGISGSLLDFVYDSDFLKKQNRVWLAGMSVY